MEFNATFLVSAISFIVFVLIMNTICYKPISEIIEKRQNFIDDTNSVAKNNFEKSETLLNDRETKLNEVKAEAKSFVTRETESANDTKSKMQAEAQKMSADKIESARNELMQSKSDAEQVLSEQIEILAGDISSKILG